MQFLGHKTTCACMHACMPWSSQQVDEEFSRHEKKKLAHTKRPDI